MTPLVALAAAAAATPQPPVAAADSPPPVVAVTPVPPPSTHVLPPPVMGPNPPLPVIVRPPQPRHALHTLITGEDYPASALRQHEEGSVGFMLDVGPDGRVHGCTITASASAALDSATCALMRRRARFSPAIDSNGMPAPGRVAGEYRWVLPQRAGAERGL